MRRLLKWAAHRWHRNPSMVRLHAEVQAFSESLTQGSRVLDAGAGDCRYRPLFAQHRYEAADFSQVTNKLYGEIDHVCDLRSIPVPDGSFDAVLCTQVLAHLPDPAAAIREFRRVLKPDGRVLLSCPLFFQENEQPYDFYRYTRFGLRHLFESAGFVLERIDWLEGYFGTLAYQLSVAAIALPGRPSAYGGGIVGAGFVPLAWALRVAFAAGCQVFTWLELRQKHTSSGQCINYIVLARCSG